MAMKKMSKLRRDILLLILLIVLGFVISSFFTRLVITPALESDQRLASLLEIGIGIFGNIQTLVAALSGIVFALLIAWMFDTYKQLQVFIPISVIFGIIVGFNFSLVEYMENVDISGGIVFVLISVGMLHLLGIPLIKFFTTANILDEEPREYKKVTRIFITAAIGLVAISLIDLYILGGSSNPGSGYQILRDSIMGGSLIILFGWLASYENKTRILFIGPGRSGKSSVIGGLYSDLNATQSNRSSDNMEVTDNRIQEISRRINNEHVLPEFTWDDEFVNFSYFERGRIFRQKRKIATLDYQGEKLIGKDDDEGFAQMVDKYRNNVLQGKTIFERIFDLLKKVNIISRESSWHQSDLNNDDWKIGETIHDSDVLIFTLPMEDFLEVPMKHGEAPPEYAATFEVIHQNPDSGEVNKYKIVYSDPNKENKEIREAESEEPGKYIDTETGEQFSDLIVDFDQLPIIDENRRYSRRIDRHLREEYLEEYGEILDEIQIESYRDILWVVTMSDLHRYKATETEQDYSNNLFRKTYQNYKNNPPDVNSESMEELDEKEAFLFDQEWFSTTPTPSTDRNAYKLFSLWVKNIYLSQGAGKLDSYMQMTGSEYLYPVWFDIKDKDGQDLIISERDNRILICSNYLIDGIEGRVLKDGTVLQHESRSPIKLFIDQREPLSNRDIKSPAEKAFGKMKLTYEDMIKEEE